MQRQKLRLRRKLLKLTQSELGRRIGLTGQAIHNYECGLRKLPDETLIKLARALDCSVVDIIEE